MTEIIFGKKIIFDIKKVNSSPTFCNTSVKFHILNFFYFDIFVKT